MKILMVTPYLPYPPASGGQIRTLNLLKYLSRKHEIYLVALYKEVDDKKYLSRLNPYCKEIYLCKRSKSPWQFKNIFGSITSLQPFLIVRNFSPEARDIIEELLARHVFDVIHSETFYVMPHIPPTATPILLVEQTVEFRVYQHFVDTLSPLVRLALSVDILKLKYWEKHYWKKASLVATVSEYDKKIVSIVEPSIQPVVIPNGAGEDMVVSRLSSKSLHRPQLLFLGNFSWLQNIEAVSYLTEKVYPLLRARFETIDIVVAGQHAGKIPHKSGIKIVDIPLDDTASVKKLYRESTLFIAPIFGPGGTRLKILAAMSSGLPVVSTKTGVEGLDVLDGKHVFIANSPDEFVKKISRILSDKALYEAIRKNAHELIREKYNWKAIAERLELAYQKIINA